jgi:hypothetical protein
LRPGGTGTVPVGGRPDLLQPIALQPTPPLDVYVDWQQQLGLDDVNDLLLNHLNLARRSGTPTQALVTGQKGAGKTTELSRVIERLRLQKVFVSFEDGSFVEALGSDVTATDILYFAADRLVFDLTPVGVTSAGTAWRGFGKPTGHAQEPRRRSPGPAGCRRRTLPPG